MPVSRYMQMCLTYPQYGYYLKRDPLGRDGDFITAPEVSQMFGELVGLWAASVWNAMGMPEHVMFIELGPGPRHHDGGRLARDPYLSRHFIEAISVHLVEASPALRDQQRLKLGGASAMSNGTIASRTSRRTARSFSPTNISMRCRSIRR